MEVKGVRAEINNGNPRKENGDDGGVLAYDISLQFLVHRDVIDDLFAPLMPKGRRFMDSYFRGENSEDTALECVFPIVYGERVGDLRAKLKIDRQELVFEPARIARGMKLEPQPGAHVLVECKLQVYPTEKQAGRLDMAVKGFAELTLEPLTEDLARAANQ